MKLTLENYLKKNAVYEKNLNTAKQELKNIIGNNFDDLGLVLTKTANSYEFKSALKKYEHCKGMIARNNCRFQDIIDLNYK